MNSLIFLKSKLGFIPCLSALSPGTLIIIKPFRILSMDIFNAFYQTRARWIPCVDGELNIRLIAIGELVPYGFPARVAKNPLRIQWKSETKVDAMREKILKLIQFHIFVLWDGKTRSSSPNNKKLIIDFLRELEVETFYNSTRKGRSGGVR